MHLTLTPQMALPGAPETAISVAGDVITIDGVAFDLGAIPEGGEGWHEGDSPFVGPIIRTDSIVRCRVIVQLSGTAEDNQPSDPAHWIIDHADGPVTIPSLRNSSHQEAV